MSWMNGWLSKAMKADSTFMTTNWQVQLTPFFELMEVFRSMTPATSAVVFVNGYLGRRKIFPFVVHFKECVIGKDVHITSTINYDFFTVKSGPMWVLMTRGSS